MILSKPMRRFVSYLALGLFLPSLAAAASAA
jgi:hypothetical protein